MPRLGKAGPQTEVIAEAAWRLFKSAPDALPCSQLSLSATEFADAPVAADKSIARFFAAVPEGQPAEPPDAIAHRTGSVPPAPDAAGAHAGPPARHKRQPRWERVKGTLAHSFARVPGATASRGSGDGVDTGHSAHLATSEQTAQAAHADHALPPDSLREEPAAGNSGLPTPSSALPHGGMTDGVGHHLAVGVIAAPAEHTSLRYQPRSQSEPVAVASPAQHSPVSPLQRPMGRSRTASAAELLARRAAFAAAAESAIAACLASAQTTPQAGSGVPQSASAGGATNRATSSPVADVAPGESPELGEPLLRPSSTASVEDAVDISTIDAREQDRILQEIARRQNPVQPHVGGAGTKRRSGGRGAGKAAKRTNQDPRQMFMERFMGAS